MDALIDVKNMYKIYNPGENEVRALDGVSLSVHKGEFVAIIGHSGSGKSTLMNMLGCLDVPTSGTYILNGRDVSSLSDNELSEVRNNEIGFIFQGFNLIPNLTVRENIEVGAYLSEKPLDTDELLHTLGLYEHQRKLPNQISGGQQQRCAIGRAIIKNPDILLCDEPTGALDFHTSIEILKLIETINQTYGNTIIMVTHNDAIRHMADRVINLKDGRIRSDLLNRKKLTAEELDW